MEQKTQFNSYSNIIKNLDFSRIKDSNSIPKELELDRDGQVSIHYIPFDYVNPKAKVVLVGITPGFTQTVRRPPNFQ